MDKPQILKNLGTSISIQFSSSLAVCSLISSIKTFVPARELFSRPFLKKSMVGNPLTP